MTPAGSLKYLAINAQFSIASLSGSQIGRERDRFAVDSSTKTQGFRCAVYKFGRENDNFSGDSNAKTQNFRSAAHEAVEQSRDFVLL